MNEAYKACTVIDKSNWRNKCPAKSFIQKVTVTPMKSLSSFSCDDSGHQ